MAAAIVYRIVVMKKCEEKTHKGKINKIQTHLDQFRFVSNRRRFTFGIKYEMKRKFRFVSLRLYRKKLDECSSKSVTASDCRKRRTTDRFCRHDDNWHVIADRPYAEGSPLRLLVTSNVYIHNTYIQ